ncbi:MAG: T9SS type A sorting domain-containing protein [Bacteroidales bacterium]|nr:T9SS type A sorting domain-containing protein [Bacteroidales bacterium]
MKKLYLILVLVAFTTLHLMASVNIYAPTLLDPDDGDDDMDPAVELDWEAVAGGIGLYYKVQISTNENFDTYQEHETELSSYTATDLLFDTTYYWRVKAIDDNEESDWSETWHFLTRVGVEMRDPDSGDDDLPPNFEIEWRGIDGVDFFDYQVDTTDSFDSPVLMKKSVEGNVTNDNTSNLYFGTDYYVRVRARHAADTTIWTETIDVRTLEAFETSSPSDGETEVMPNDELEWDEVAGIDKYIVRLALDHDMQVIVSSDEVSDNSLDADTLDFGTTYFMNVSAFHAKDTIYSDTISFETINTVELNSPANEMTNVEVGPTLKWKKINGSSKYQLQIGNDPDLGDLEVKEVINTNPTGYVEYEVPSALTDSGMTYYWHVRALHTDDTTMWSETWSFTIAAVGIGETDANAFNIYPNPAHEHVRIVFEAPEKDALIRLSDLTGRIIREIHFDGVTNELPIDLNMNSGLYILTVETEEGISTRKLHVR